eukprot:8847143-Karenia_brevis.AAC.1
MSQAGAIMAVYTGALWPVIGYHEIHLFYTGPKVTTSRHPMIVKTQHLVDIARRNNYSPPCYYLRGLQPQANITPTVDSQWCACGLGADSDLSHLTGGVTIYTDGSGGTR